MATKAKGYIDKGFNADEVARQLTVSRRTLFLGLRAARDHDELIANHWPSQPGADQRQEDNVTCSFGSSEWRRPSAWSSYPCIRFGNRYAMRSSISWLSRSPQSDQRMRTTRLLHRRQSTPYLAW